MLVFVEEPLWSDGVPGRPNQLLGWVALNDPQLVIDPEDCEIHVMPAMPGP